MMFIIRCDRRREGRGEKEGEGDAGAGAGAGNHHRDRPVAGNSFRLESMSMLWAGQIVYAIFPKRDSEVTTTSTCVLNTFIRQRIDISSQDRLCV